VVIVPALMDFVPLKLILARVVYLVFTDLSAIAPVIVPRQMANVTTEYLGLVIVVLVIVSLPLEIFANLVLVSMVSAIAASSEQVLALLAIADISDQFVTNLALVLMELVITA